MASDPRYLAHLRQRAGDVANAQCPLCKQRTRLGDSESFSTHLSQFHGEEIDKLSKEPTWNFSIWKETLEARARNSESLSTPKEADNSPPPSHSRTDRNATRSPAEELSQLNLNKAESSVPGFPTDGDPRVGRRKRANSVGDQGAPHQTLGRKTSRRVGDQYSSHDSQGRSAVANPQARNFKGHFDDTGELVSRKLFNPNPVSEASTGQATYTSRAYSSTPGAQLTSSSQHHATQSSSDLPQSSRERGGIAMPIDPRFPDMLMQPDSRPISQEQLAAEVKSIYAGLTMVESKCIHVDKAQAAAMRNAEKGKTKLADDHWQALIALHRTLLHEHHDFFLASQHPSASPALRRLASKYSMPSRMWKHGIHSFLELLRFRLPDSLEFMISFIYTAYQMMSLLYETVPAFEDTWIECLGDLGRYRMAIEDEDIRDRETWAGVARFWYSKAADRSPDVGRLYHHLAILARPNALQQLYLYSRSLISVQVFQSARDSILTLFNPIMGRSDASSSHISPIDTSFIKTHAILFGKEQLDEYQQLRDTFLGLLDAHIGRVTAKWREQGAYMMIANLGALFDYGNESPLRRLFEYGFFKLAQNARSKSHSSKPHGFDAPSPSSESTSETLAPFPTPDPTSQTAFGQALDLTLATSVLVFKRIGDNNVLPFAHILLAFLQSLGSLQSFDFQVKGIYVASSILGSAPWEQICTYLNTLARSIQPPPHFESVQFIRPEQGDARPLPEDHLIRGQIWSQDYFPGDWFKESEVDDEERSIEHASTVRVRAERVLWLAFRLASYKQWILYDATKKTWSPIAIRNEKNSLQLTQSFECPSPFPAIAEPKDVTMIDADPGYASDEDSPEMKALNKEQRHQTAAEPDRGRLNIPLHKSSEAAELMLQKGFTVMVCDQTLLLKDRDVFELLVERRYQVVVPHQVLADLSILSKKGQPDSLAAQKALDSVKTAYSRNSDVRILTASGDDTTKHQLSSERPITPRGESPLETSDSADERKDDLIGVTRRATQNMIDQSSETMDQPRSAILLTEDRLTRVRAAGAKVAALAPSMLRRILSTAGSKIRSRSSSRLPDQAGNRGQLDVDQMEI